MICPRLEHPMRSAEAPNLDYVVRRCRREWAPLLTLRIKHILPGKDNFKLHAIGSQSATCRQTAGVGPLSD